MGDVVSFLLILVAFVIDILFFKEMIRSRTNNSLTRSDLGSCSTLHGDDQECSQMKIEDDGKISMKNCSTG